MSAIVKPKKTVYLHYAIWAVIQIIIWNIPASEPLTTTGMHTLAAFVGLIYGMCFMPSEYGLYTLGCIVVMGFSGVFGGVAESFNTGLGTGTWPMMFMILLFSAVITASGLMEFFARKLVSMKLTAGKPWNLTMVLLIGSFIFGLFINSMIVLIVLVELLFSICKQVNMKGNLWTCLMIASINVVGMFAMNIMPFQLVNAATFGILGTFDPNMTFQSVAVPHMVYNFILNIIIIIVCFLIIRLTCGKSVDDLKNYVPQKNVEKMSKDMKISLWILIVFVILQIIALFPSGPVVDFINTFGMHGMCALACIAAIFIRKEDGSPWLSFDEIAKKGVLWGHLMQVCALVCVSSAIIADSTGIINWMLELVKPLTDGAGAWGCFAILLAACAVLTNFTDNMAVSFMAVPLVYVLGIEQGIHPAGFLSIVIPAFEAAFLLPSSLLNTEYVFQLEPTGYVKGKTLIIYALPIIVITWIVNVTLGWAFQPWFASFIGV